MHVLLFYEMHKKVVQDSDVHFCKIFLDNSKKHTSNPFLRRQSLQTEMKFQWLLVLIVM